MKQFMIQNNGAWILAALLASSCVDNQTHPDLQPWLPAGNMPGGLGCVPNLDGTIATNELPVATGAVARQRLAFDRPVDVAGSINTQGQRVWDWGWSAAAEYALAVGPEDLSGKWYAAQFPGGQFAVAFDVDGYLDAVYQKNEQGLWLMGLASRAEKPAQGKTLLRYDTPVKSLPLPLKPPVSWTSTGKVSGGLLYGLPYAGVDTYESTADLTGRLVLPDLQLEQAYRVLTTVTATPAVGQTVKKQQISFFTECLGEVARATGTKLQADSATAQEIRRLAL